MTSLSELSGYWLVHSLGWTLLHFCWQGALVGVVLWCALQWMGRHSSQLRYALACGALGLMVALPLATLARVGLHDYRTAVALRNVAPDPSQALLVQAGAGKEAIPWSTRMEATLDRSVPWVLIAWFAGAVLFLVRLNVGFMVARRITSFAVQLAPDELQVTFRGMARRLGVMRPVKLLTSALVQVPTVIGWLRPVVLIPVSCFTGLSEVQIEAILCHELAHIRRHDYLVSVVQSVVEALLFYHPAVWWVSRQVRRERECCCDDVTVRVGGDVLAYAHALNTLEERRSMYPEVTLGVDGGVLTMRIKRLLGYTEKSAVSLFASTAMLAIVVMTGGLVGGSLVHAQSNAVKTGQNAAIAPPTPAPDAVTSSPNAQQAQTDTLQPEVRDQIEGAKRLAMNLSEQLRDVEVARANAAVIQAEARRQAAESHELNAEDQKRLEEAMQRLRESLAKLHSSDFQKQMEEARAAATKVNTPEFRKQIDEAARAQMKADAVRAQIDAKLNSPEFKKQIEDATKAATRFNTPEFRKQMEEAAKAASKINTPEFRKQIEDPRRAAEQVNTPEFRAQLRAQIAENASPPVVASIAPGADGASAADGRTGPIHVSPGSMQGNLVSKVTPVYPPDAKAGHIEGTVVLRAIISKGGTVEQVQVVAGPDALRQSTLDAVRQWTYKPYLLNGEPVEVETTITVNFTLDDPGKNKDKSQKDDRKLEKVSRKEGDVLALSRIGGTVSAPVVIYQMEPEFSAEARKARFNGIVLVNLVVDNKGVPQNVHVLRGVGMGLDEKAVAAVKQYRFKPAMDGDAPVAVPLNIEVSFQVFDGPEKGR